MYNAHATRIMYHGMRYETRVHTGHTEARVHLVKARKDEEQSTTHVAARATLPSAVIIPNFLICG